MEERKLIITMHNPGDSKVAPRISDKGGEIASFELLMAISALTERFVNVEPDALKDKDSEDSALNLFGAAVSMGLENKSEEYAKQVVMGLKKLLVKKFVEKKAKEVMRDAGIDFGDIDDDKEDDEDEG
jgi:hypothetical protein